MFLNDNDNTKPDRKSNSGPFTLKKPTIHEQKQILYCYKYSYGDFMMIKSVLSGFKITYLIFDSKIRLLITGTV